MQSSFLLSLPLLGLCAICFILASAVLRNRDSKLRLTYSALMFATGVLIIEYVFELGCDNLNSILFWNDLEYIESVCLAPLFFLLVLIYTGKGRWFEGVKMVALLFVIPMISLSLLWTNNLHHLFYIQTTTSTWGPFVVFSGNYGPAFWLYAGYTHFLTIISAMLLLYTYLNSSQAYHPEVKLIAIAAFLPIASHLMSFYNLAPLPTTYLSAFFLTATGVLIFKAVCELDLPDPVPLALNRIVESMKDGVIVLDARKNVVHLNPSAQKILERPARQTIGRPLDSQYQLLMERLERNNFKDPEAQESCKVFAGEKRYFSAQLSTLKSETKTLKGYILVLRDITEEKMVKEALRTANAKLNLLSSLTRHDILNELTALKGYNELLNSLDLQDGKIHRYVEGIMESSTAIEKFIKFTREYQDLGMKTPRWQLVNDSILEAMVAISAILPEIEVDTEALEVFADLMLSRVFYNLIGNSITHGRDVTKIRIHSLLDNRDIIIAYEDNGVGIPFEYKERIFEPGFGINTGIGLYVSREILGITECSIIENGIPGKGVRFEIRVPCGRWRHRT